MNPPNIKMGSVSFNHSSTPGWKLQDGPGIFTQFIKFDHEFNSTPEVNVSMNTVETNLVNGELYVYTSVEDVVEGGFVVKIENQQGTRLYGIGISWLAVA